MEEEFESFQSKHNAWNYCMLKMYIVNVGEKIILLRMEWKLNEEKFKNKEEIISRLENV